MKEELNRTINVLQRLTNKIVDIKQKSEQCLNQTQYNQLTGRIANIEQMFKQKVKSGILRVKQVKGIPNDITINNSCKYSVTTIGFTDWSDWSTIQFIQFEYPLTISGVCPLPDNEDYFRIVDQNGNILHEEIGGNEYEFTIYNGPYILYIEAACFD